MSSFTRCGEATFAIELSRLMHSWINAKKNRSLNRLAKLLASDMSHSTVYSTYKLKSLPGIETVEKILHVVVDFDEYTKYMNTYFPDLVHRRISIATESEQHNDQDMMPFFSDLLSAKVLLLATDGTNEDEIADKCGKPGLKVISEMKSFNITENKGSLIKACDFVISGMKNVSKVIRMTLNIVESNRNENRDHIYNNWTVSKISREESEKIKKIYVEAAEKAAIIRKNSKGGTCRVAFGAFISFLYFRGKELKILLSVLVLVSGTAVFGGTVFESGSGTGYTIQSSGSGTGFVADISNSGSEIKIAIQDSVSGGT